MITITTTTTTRNPPVTTLSSIRKDTNMTDMNEEPQHPTWLSFAEYGIIGCVSAVIIGGIGVCCKKCLGLLSKRDNDEDEEHRRKMYKKARQAFGAPAIRPMYIENKKT
ncbi:uncharacterized protein LOC134283865 [Saccostrea cucullata]|uniref:uncharacterized protein LOC134283865 n=1 Tax=Saccostrea cuccullata TaxID=36930 RepID=UPI002ECFCD76